MAFSRYIVTLHDSNHSFFCEAAILFGFCDPKVPRGFEGDVLFATKSPPYLYREGLRYIISTASHKIQTATSDYARKLKASLLYLDNVT